MKKLWKVWKNKNKIIEGVWNSWFPNQFVEKIAAERKAICESNVCGYFDKDGTSEEVYVKGSSGCKACGCNTKWSTNSLSKVCGLVDIGKNPLWGAVMTEQEESLFRQKTKLKNE